MIPETFRVELAANGAIELTLKVIPKSSRDEIVGVQESGALKVKVTAAPEKGKANVAVCEVLARAFAVSRRNVTILQGETSQNKRVRITLG